MKYKSKDNLLITTPVSLWNYKNSNCFLNAILFPEKKFVDYWCRFINKEAVTKIL